MIKKNITALILAAVAVFVMLSSALVIINHADHDCVGEDCPVCEYFYSCIQNQKDIAAALLVAAVRVLALIFLLCCGVKWFTPVYSPHTLVLLKVRLSN